MKAFKFLLISSALLIVYACSHPIEIVGEGDVSSNFGRVCMMEGDEPGETNCSRNYVVGNYFDTYTAVARTGWEFDSWGNCNFPGIGVEADNTCTFTVPAATVAKAWGQTAPPLTAVFTPLDPTGACFTLTNTPDEDFNNNNWFDACVEAEGSMVRIVLKDGGGSVLYEATGAKVGTWTYDHITSETSEYSQYNSSNHHRLVTLNNGDKLMITGRYSDNGLCFGSMGSGYGIVLYGSAPYQYTNPKMLVMPYRLKGPIHAAGEPRAFTSWTSGHEITWGDGGEFNICSTGVGGLEHFGSFEVYVE